MGQIPRISEAEWQVMKILWESSPQNANQVIDQLAETANWKPKTVKTLLNRLTNKGAIGFKKEGRTYLYYPLVGETECVTAESKSFLNRVYGGALNIMLANFIEEEQLNKEDIAELKRILDLKEGNKER